MSSDDSGPSPPDDRPRRRKAPLEIELENLGLKDADSEESSMFPWDQGADALPEQRNSQPVPRARRVGSGAPPASHEPTADRWPSQLDIPKAPRTPSVSWPPAMDASSPPPAAPEQTARLARAEAELAHTRHALDALRPRLARKEAQLREIEAKSVRDTGVLRARVVDLEARLVEHEDARREARELRAALAKRDAQLERLERELVVLRATKHARDNGSDTSG
ncbi:MAG: hypothetical protein MJD61_12455 [Proteobacteria bacterium]|nr:hypothetical protein [Pseudomonadota bacterium]